MGCFETDRALGRFTQTERVHDLKAPKDVDAVKFAGQISFASDLLR
jgi:hypothetical protein